MKHEDVAKAWIKGRKAKGHVSTEYGSGSYTFYTDGRVIYSFGEHYPVGVFLDCHREKAALCGEPWTGSIEYGGSDGHTGKHRSHAARALRNAGIPFEWLSLNDMRKLVEVRKERWADTVVLITKTRYLSSEDPLARPL